MKILDFLDLFISLNVIILGIIIFLNLAKKSIYYIFFGTANLFVGSGILLDSIIKLNPGIFWYTMGLEYPCGLMLGPIIWMLSIASVKNKFHWKFKLYLSIAPVLLVLLSYLILWDLPLLRRRLFEQALNHRNVIFHDLDIFTYLYILFFLILALVRITKIRNHINRIEGIKEKQS